MEITVTIPDEFARQIIPEGRDPSTARLWKIWQSKPTAPIVSPVHSSVVYWESPPGTSLTLF